jgi:CTD small phosphatase-like protein 2
VRPFAEEFLVEASKFYEIVIFTAALPAYADFILNIIDKQKVISHRLYR